MTYDRALAPGWRHLAAVRAGGSLKLTIDGEAAGISSSFDPSGYRLSNEQPLKIGFGTHDYFHGSLSDLRLYRRALSDGEIRELRGQ